MGERIMTLHPDGEQGVNIERVKYNVISRLDAALAACFSGSFDGAIGWYITTL